MALIEGPTSRRVLRPFDASSRYVLPDFFELPVLFDEFSPVTVVSGKHKLRFSSSDLVTLSFLPIFSPIFFCRFRSRPVSFFDTFLCQRSGLVLVVLAAVLLKGLAAAPLSGFPLWVLT